MKLQAVTSSNESLKYEECFSNQRIEKLGREKSIASFALDNASLSSISLNYDKSLEN